MTLKSANPKTLLAAMAGLLIAVPASAQPYGHGPDGARPADEEVIVTAPPQRAFREDGNGLRALALPPEKVSLSKNVRYSDLDLATWQGAQELRHRVRRAARHVCRDLTESYPYERLSTSENCYRDAVSNGLVRADAAISEAQFESWNGGDE